RPERVVNALISLNVTRAHSDSAIGDFADDILRALDLRGSDLKKSKDRLSALLASEPISTNVKALQLQQDHERLLVRSHIVTDARPVFGASVRKAPVTMLITHTLKLSYYEEGRTREFYIALDSEDITGLKEALTRAEDKANSLAKTLE